MVADHSNPAAAPKTGLCIGVSPCSIDGAYDDPPWSSPTAMGRVELVGGQGRAGRRAGLGRPRTLDPRRTNTDIGGHAMQEPDADGHVAGVRHRSATPVVADYHFDYPVSHAMEVR
jgi:hypothetical protein